MTPDPLPPLCEAVINFEGQAPMPCNLPADHPGHCEFGSAESMRHEAAALDGLASNGPARAYTMGYEDGRRDKSVEIATADLVGGGYTPAQEARADALAAASHLFAESLGTDWDDPDDPANAARAVLAVAAKFATWIEHGDQPKVCAPIPCPPFEQADLTVDHRFDWSDVDGRIMASCPCGWTSDPVKSVDAAYGLWVDHVDSDGALDIVRGNFDLLGDRLDQALDAAKQAQPRAHPERTS